MGQGLEPLTADLCLSSRSQPPQLPSRADFFEQSKKRNVFRASTATTTTTKNTKAARAAAAQLQPQLLLSPLRGPSTVTTTTTLVRKPLPARTWTKWHQTARPRTTLTASGIGCSVTRVPRATTTTTTRVHRRPPARVTVTTTGIRTWTNCQQRWPQQREQWQQKGHQGDDDDDTRSRSTILSSMLPDFPSNANTMEFG